MATRTRYAKIPIAAIGGLAGEGAAEVAIFLPSSSSNGPVLYRREGADLSDPDYGRLREHGVSHIFVRSEDLCKCEMVVESRLEAILAHEAFSPPEKAVLVHQIGASVARDIAHAEAPSANLPRARQLIDNVISCVLDDPQIAEHMLNMAGHERTVASHMFMVSSLGVMLASEVFGPDVNMLQSVGVAGMLHDLGKLMIPPHILNKQGPLSAEEIQLIEHHPIESVRLINDDPLVSPLMRQMILQHHERVDGRGYPVGVSGPDLLPGSRILAIVDSFHAMIGRRSYRAAMTPVDANRVMNAFSGTQFDPSILKVWNDLFVRSWNTEGAERPTDTPAPPGEIASRHEHRQSSPARDIQFHRKRRHLVRKNVTVRCVYAGRLRDANDAPESFVASVHDVSRGGMCLYTHHPMFRGEVVHLQIHEADQQAWVRAVIAWCRQHTGATYRTGVRFLERITEEQAMQKVPVLNTGIPGCHELEADEESPPGENGHMPLCKTEEDKEAEALAALDEISSEREITVEAERTVIALASARSAQVRIKTAPVLARINTRAAKTVLLSLLDDAQAEVRRSAIGVVGAMKLHDAIVPLQANLKDQDPATALRAAAALGQLGDHSGSALVRKFLQEDGENARLAAVALGQIVGHRFAANEDGVAAARRYLTHVPKHTETTPSPSRNTARTSRYQKKPIRQPQRSR